MMNNNQKLNIQFDFKKDGSNKGPLLFSNPIKIISTSNPHEIQHCLNQIDKAVEEGYYAAGYMSYEAINACNNTDKINTMPLLVFGIYHKPGKIKKNIQQSTFQISTWKLLESTNKYKENFHKVMKAIEDGLIEEVNYTVPFKATFIGDSFAYYNQLKKAQQANYCAYLSMDGFDILSASPELFFKVENNTVTARPMKGTIHRGYTYETDLQHKEWLSASEKNKLENTIIKDLMEKELEKVTIPGTLRTIDPFRVEKYPTVYQMTSGLKGDISPETSIMEIMETLFPCGSIAGVPKAAGLKLIQSLESHPREIYCGTIGYITPKKKAVFNVPIRTVWIDRKKQTAHYGAGGAITIHSEMEEELREIHTKADVLTWKQPDFDLLETIGLHEGSYTVLDHHIKRLQESAAYFDFSLDLKNIEQQLQQLKVTHDTGSWRVRLTVSQNGSNDITTTSIQKSSENKLVRFADAPINKNSRFLYHKTTNRTMYQQLQQKDVFDVLLWNEEGAITEFTIGNIVVEIDGTLFTPPVSCGLLPGTFRKHLLEENVIQEKELFKQDIITANNIWLINSVRKWVKVTVI